MFTNIIMGKVRKGRKKTQNKNRNARGGPFEGSRVKDPSLKLRRYYYKLDLKDFNDNINKFRDDYDMLKEYGLLNPDDNFGPEFFGIKPTIRVKIIDMDNKSDSESERKGRRGRSWNSSWDTSISDRSNSGSDSSWNSRSNSGSDSSWNSRSNSNRSASGKKSKKSRAKPRNKSRAKPLVKSRAKRRKTRS